MDSDDAEGAELPPIDAKNIAGAGTKRRVDRAHDPSRLTHGVRGAGASAAALAGAELPPVDAEEKNMSGAGKRRRVERAHDPSRHTRGMRGAGASAAALAMRATDSDDTEGAEPMAAAKEKARQEAEVELIRVAEAKQRQVVAKKAQKQQQAEVAAMEKEGARSRKVREEEGVATANTQGETNGAATYVTPPRPRPPHIHTYPPVNPPVAPALLCRHQPLVRRYCACFAVRVVVVGPRLLLVGRGGRYRLVTLSPRYLPRPRLRSRRIFW